MNHLPPDALFSPLFGQTAVAELFTDDAQIAAWLRVEATLAEVEGALGVIPATAAAAIAAAGRRLVVDHVALRAATEQAGVPIAGLVGQLRAAVGEPAADYVHWGATTQDIMDTALVLQLREALRLMGTDLQALGGRLARLADRHRDTLMAGRTHAQQATPITFGLKVAGWLAPLIRHAQRLTELERRLNVIQFGGAAGTLAALGDRGPAVQAALAEALALGVPALPWHAQRDRLAELAGWLSLVTGSLAKMAQDIILLTQSEVGELRESGDPARGGSSTMPQKHNPVVAETIVAAARTNAALLGAVHQAQVQEHERGTHGWQVEWLTLPQMVILTAGALRRAAALCQTLVVDERRMAATVAASRGLMLAEAISLALTAVMGHREAAALVRAAARDARADGRHLVDVVRDRVDADLDWAALRDERRHTGAADHFIDRVLRAAESVFMVANEGAEE